MWIESEQIPFVFPAPRGHAIVECGASCNTEQRRTVSKSFPDNAQVVSQSIHAPLPQHSPQFTWHNYHFLALLLPFRRPTNANIWDRRKGLGEARAGLGAQGARCCRAAWLPSEGADAWLG